MKKLLSIVVAGLVSVTAFAGVVSEKYVKDSQKFGKDLLEKAMELNRSGKTPEAKAKALRDKLTSGGDKSAQAQLGLSDGDLTRVIAGLLKTPELAYVLTARIASQAIESAEAEKINGPLDSLLNEGAKVGSAKIPKAIMESGLSEKEMKAKAAILTTTLKNLSSKSIDVVLSWKASERELYVNLVNRVLTEISKDRTLMPEEALLMALMVEAREKNAKADEKEQLRVAMEKADLLKDCE